MVLEDFKEEENSLVFYLNFHMIEINPIILSIEVWKTNQGLDTYKQGKLSSTSLDS